MIDLGEGFTAEIDRIAEREWDDLLSLFADATIYQSWSYGAIRWHERSLSHMVLSKDGQIVGAAQVAIKRLPLLPAGIAYVPWGPMWRLRNEDRDLKKLSVLLRALRDEFAVRRGLLVRITPNEIETTGTHFFSLAFDHGFVRTGINYRTLLIDLSLPKDEILRRAARRWRRALKTAESNGLSVEEGTEGSLFRVLVTLHKEMVARKGFVPGVDIEEFERIQERLLESHKMHTMIATAEGKPVAALAASLIGEKGIGLVGATSTVGLNMGGFQLLNWRMMAWLQQRGALWYDFGGYDPEKNPGTASFKEGLPGLDISHVGQFECCNSALSRIAVGFGERSLKFCKRQIARSQSKIVNNRATTRDGA